MATAQIRINKTKELTELLGALRMMFRVLDESEIVKLALSRFYEEEIQKKLDAKISALPYMELTDEEQESLTEGIKSLEQAKKDGTLKPMTPEELMEEIRNTPDE